MATHQAVEVGKTEGEDATVAGDEPVAMGIEGYTDDRSREGYAVHSGQLDASATDYAVTLIDGT